MKDQAALLRLIFAKFYWDLKYIFGRNNFNNNNNHNVRIYKIHVIIL